MSRTALSNRLPWDDRWSRPSLPQLIQPLKAHHRRAFETLMNELTPLPSVERSILWYGPAWKWTIHFTLPPQTRKSGKGAQPSEPDTLCYLVPRIESPMVCVPLSEAVIEQLPMQRLSKLIRDGIKMAKCAVAIHWACWTPNNQGEVAHIVDLVKRRHKLTVGLEDKPVEVKPKAKGA
jgi:hypothetical protein